MLGDLIRKSAGVRLVVISGVSLFLLIPAQMIQGLIREREQTQNQALSEMGTKWGRTQALTGPILTVPFHVREKDEKGRSTVTTRHAHFLPDELRVRGTVRPEVRYRGIYEAVLYNGKLSLSATFPQPDARELGVAEGDLLRDQAFVSIGISDLKGIREAVRIRWDGAYPPANPGVPSSDAVSSGLSAPVALRRDATPYTLAVELDLNGSGELSFAPVGKDTRVALSSTWASPSFQGDFLPTARTVSKEGFSAEWKVLNLNRNYPQKWLGTNSKLAASTFGVSFLLPVDGYAKTTRTAKYALLFIALTFSCFFCIEILGGRTIHPIQYLLVGLALVTFYTLLLSLSEQISFAGAYITAAISVVALVSGYAASALRSARLGTVVATLLAGLYGYLYVLLQLEDYALLLGSIGLFALLALFMFLTRKVDWFTVLRPPGTAEAGQTAGRSGA